MELKNLTTFYHASRFLNYSKTAEYLNFTQPAVTKQIKGLEEELGQQLFMRMGNKTYLTPAGTLLQNYAKKIFELVEELDNEMSHLATNSGILRIGADISFITNNLQPVISEFYRTNPNIQTKIITSNSSLVIPRILMNELDVGFISGDHDNAQIINVDISDDPVIMVVSSQIYYKYKLSYIKKKYPLIRYKSPSFYSKQLEYFLKINHLTDHGSIEFSNLEAVKSAAVQGVGISAVTKDIVYQELKSGILIEIEEKYSPVSIKTSMIYHKEKEQWASIQSLQKLVKKLWVGDSSNEV